MPKAPDPPAGGPRLPLTARAGLTGAGLGGADHAGAAARALAAVRDHVPTAFPAGRM